MVDTGKIAARLLEGYNKTAVFAITSNCNCRCEMCNIYDNKPIDIPFSDAKRVLDFMAAKRFLIAYFTGGEPSLHPDLVKIVEYANNVGLVTSLTTNGTIPTSMLKELKAAGLHTLSVSIDTWDLEQAEKIRRHNGILQKQKKTVETARNLGVRVYGLTYLGSHLTPQNIEKLVNFVNFSLKIPFGFCYPVMTNKNTYLLGHAVQPRSTETTKIVELLLKLKKSGYRIVNTISSMEDIIRHNSGQASKYPCRSGEYVFYIDWFGDIYPCFMKKKLFSALEPHEHRLPTDVTCDDCLIDCFREPSLLAYVFSPGFIVREAIFGASIKEIIF